MRRRGLYRATAVLVAWTLFGIVEGSQSFFVRALGPEPISLGYALKISLPRWWLWAALTPAVIAFCRWIPVRRRHLVRSVLAHIVAGTVVAGFALLLGGLIYYGGVYEGDLPMSTMLPRYFGAHSAMAIIAYVAVVGAYHAWDYHVRLTSREVEAARASARASSLEASLSQARLDTLKGQLQPHFLFNALNTVSALALQGERQQATRVVALLSDLLRTSLDAPADQLVPLRAEIDFVDRYLEIERARFGPRLGTEIHVDPEVEEARVPALLLQPLVENAIRHGIAPRGEGGTVSIRAERVGPSLRVTVQDDGPGLPRRVEPGVGLGATRERLHELYGDAAELRLEEGEQGGARVAVLVPWSTPERRPEPSTAEVP